MRMIFKGEVHPDENLIVKIAEKIIKNIAEGLRKIHQKIRNLLEL